MQDTPPHPEYEVRDRRPMPPREWAVMRWLTNLAIRLGLSANAVSVLSVVFASLGAAATVFTYSAEGFAQRALWFIGAAGVELRAFCNLLDGMVAVETQTASPVGELYNEVPDRISDVLMLVGLGYAAGSTPELGWAAAAAAVFVAYVRAQAAVSGAGQDYGGLMSKPVRMQLVAVVCLFMAFSPEAWQLPFWGPKEVGPKLTWPTWGVLQGVLWIVLIGCVVTSIGRLHRASRRLHKGVA
ncbi:CDP-alcohol phosphatidyltransferase family protein [Algisphaera agarilytica]|uniref:Phosphatidylglycerophosphate synthase n=1 Tax=Algisphaera agarilytica TaxID=1385975 RepID=A0A7X0LJD3_9BACT|nr:CDP-alcohol phosphatidyltransferase family protein [Algisphaera agarilytica]MBB6428654.1 phosphatidylglycerophosphate synthase [Algisphaera agarilytica]